MQILSKFYHNKHLTRLYDNSVLLSYFTHHNAQIRCYSTTFIKKTLVIDKNIIINSKANKYQQNHKQTILP